MDRHAEHHKPTIKLSKVPRLEPRHAAQHALQRFLSPPTYGEVIATLPRDAEFGLLAAVTARPFGPRHDEVISGAVAGGIDWPRFLKLVGRHRIAPLAFQGLASVRAEVPAPILRDLRAAAMRDRVNSLQLVSVLAAITARLSAAGVEAVSIKGPTLALLAFRDASLRQCRDLDILISPQHVERALAILQTDCKLIQPADLDAPDKLRRWARIMKDASLLHKPTGAIIELHWRLNDNPYLLPASVATSRQAVSFGSFAVKTLASDDLLLYLCVHGAKHHWFRLKWLADVYALLGRRKAHAVEQFYDHACAHGLGVPARQMLLLLETIYGMTIPREIKISAARSWRVSLIMRQALRYMQEIDEPEQARFATTMMAFGRLFLHSNPRYAAREAMGTLIDWPIALGAGGSRYAYVLAIVGRPVFWIVRKIKGQNVAG